LEALGLAAAGASGNNGTPSSAHDPFKRAPLMIEQWPLPQRFKAGFPLLKSCVAATPQPVPVTSELGEPIIYSGPVIARTKTLSEQPVWRTD
jgi:hypothetical protein